MKTIWNYVLGGLVTAFVCFCWTCFFDSAFRGVLAEQRIALGVGLFLAAELVVLAGIIVSKIDRNKPSDTEK